MTSMQMIRADVDIPTFHKWMGVRQLRDPDHAMHCLLVECFGPDCAPKPFRAIFPRAAQTGCLYGYGDGGTTSNTLQDALNLFADPLQCQIIPPDSIASKPMPTQWEPGMRLGFEARVRPIVRSRRFTENRSVQELDAYQHACMTWVSEDDVPSRETVYQDWLTQQFERHGGATLEAMQMVSFRVRPSVRKRSGAHSKGPDALIRGILKVVDGPNFAKFLTRGIGRHRAYGYGMMLLKPHQQVGM